MPKKVVVVGAGNAALCATIAAAQNDAEVTVLEAASQEEFGGNSRYTAAALRFAYEGRDHIMEILDDATKQDEKTERTDFGSYPVKTFIEELATLSENQGNKELQNILAEQSRPTVVWLKESGVRWLPIYSRQSYEVDGKYVFWGGLTLAAENEGEGLVQKEYEIAKNLGVKFLFEAPAKELISKDGKVTGVKYEADGKLAELAADAVVLACGGFESNAELRKKHIGPGWDKAKVRGTRHNQGEGLTMATAIGAKTCGNFGGCHAVFMDSNSPDYGNLDIPHIDRKNYRKISYPFGVILNRDGKRFVDEGADFRNYTYAKYGREVLAQPEGFAWQIFDSQVTKLLYQEYNMKDATKRTADSLEDLIAQLDDIDQQQALQTLKDFNESIDKDAEFNPTVKDGKSAKPKEGPPKSNWASPLEQGPFSAYRVTCGITFTYGGLAIDKDARVLDSNDKVILGLYASGEMVGDIFHHNYPGGSGLTSGSVFGRISGVSAATD